MLHWPLISETPCILTVKIRTQSITFIAGTPIVVVFVFPCLLQSTLALLFLFLFAKRLFNATMAESPRTPAIHCASGSLFLHHLSPIIRGQKRGTWMMRFGVTLTKRYIFCVLCSGPDFYTWMLHREILWRDLSSAYSVKEFDRRRIFSGFTQCRIAQNRQQCRNALYFRWKWR